MKRDSQEECCVTMQVSAKGDWQRQKLRERHGTDFLLELSRERGPVDTLISDFWNVREYISFVLSHSRV